MRNVKRNYIPKQDYDTIMSKANPCEQYQISHERFLEALQQKIRQAEECLYRLGFNKIVPSMRKKGATLEDACDVFHEGIIAFNLRVNSLTPGASPTTILYSIVHNKWIDMFRARKNIDTLPEELAVPCPEPSPIEKLLDSEMQQELRKAINKLKPSSRQLMDMLFYQELEPEEVAKQLSLSVKSVYNQKYRCIKYLRRWMEGGKVS